MMFSAVVCALLIVRRQRDLNRQQLVIPRSTMEVRRLAFRGIMLSSCCNVWPQAPIDLL